MNRSVPAEIATQLSQTLEVIEHHLAPVLLAVHVYGSALDGGLKPDSDIDLLLTVAAEIDAGVRQSLMADLLKVSAPPGSHKTLRALEVTVVVHSDIIPWHYPARRLLQFGEWLRDEILAGVVEPAVIDPDLAILLTHARQHGIALVGLPAAELFNSVPEGDFFKALNDALNQWRTPSDWAGDEKNVVLTLARIWYSAASGKIAPKEVAANWALERLPENHHAILSAARQAYLGYGADCLALRGARLTEFVAHIKREAAIFLAGHP